MLTAVMLFTFFVFERKRPSGANLVQIVNIVNLRLNLVDSIGIFISHTHQQEYHQLAADGTC